MYDPLQSGYSQEDFYKFIIERNCAVIATPRSDWGVQVATVFYATNDGRSLFMKFHTTSDHGSQIKRNPRVAAAIYNHDSTYHEKYGVQLLGYCKQITNRELLENGMEIFSHKFPGARERFAPIDELLSPSVKSTLFCFTPHSGKMLTPAGYSENYQSLG